MVVAEVTLAFTLLVSAGLVLRSLVASYRVDMGFRTDDAISFAISPPSGSYGDDASAAAFHRELSERIAAVPGVLDVASSSGPLGPWSNTPYTIPEQPADSTVRRVAWDRVASETYQRVMEMRMATGRWFDDDLDLYGGAAAAVVSLPIAERDWGSAAAALGRRIDFHGRAHEIVGVVDVGRLLGPQQPSPPVVFEAASQHPARQRHYVVDVTSNQAAVVVAIRAAVRSLDPGVAIYQVETLDDQFRDMVSMETVMLRIFGTLAVLTLLLTFVGIYGVMAHSVERRSREIGLRMALGARRGRLVTLVLGQSGRITLVALATGIGLSLVLGRGMSSFVVGLQAWDPAVQAAAAILVLVAALLASLIPALRASRVDPVDVLRKA
jgi:predicted permease